MSDEDFNPFEDDSDETDSGTTASRVDANKSFKELRTAYNRAEKERKALLAEAEELRAFRTQVVEKQKDEVITSVFQEVGLNPQHAKLYKALNPQVEPDQISAEAVAAFAAEYALITTSGETVEAPEPKPQGFRPVETVGSAAPNAMLSTDDIKQMLANGDSEGVAKAYRDGRVQKESPNWTVV